MKRHVFSLFLRIVLVLGLSFAGGQAWAGSRAYDFIDTCTTTNCNTTRIDGYYAFDEEGSSNPFFIQVFAGHTECLRVGVTYHPNDDLEIVLISPDGKVWRNNNQSLNSTLPLVKAITDGQAGIRSKSPTPAGRAV